MYKSHSISLSLSLSPVFFFETTGLFKVISTSNWGTNIYVYGIVATIIIGIY